MKVHDVRMFIVEHGRKLFLGDRISAAIHIS
jgi:hypothetical protein